MTRKENIYNAIILGLVVIVAILLRFYNYFEIPFTHDEFSALFRTRYDSLNEVVFYGVMKGDTHPAGVQVFLYYWINAFGQSEWVVKLPFTLAGLGGLVYAYLIGKKWFNTTVALLIIAQLASMQYVIMYSQIARPYISGFFLAMGMVYYWTLLIQNQEKFSYKNAGIFILFAAASAYNHHFSLLFAAIVGIAGVFLIRKEYLLKYALSGLLIFLLYLPHLKVFLYQLNQGGIEGWLGKPENDFFWEYLRYAHHFSVVSMGISSLLFLASWFYRSDKKGQMKWRLIALVWSLLPFLVGFFYSTYLSAVLQYSMLLFNFPFVLLCLYGGIKPLKPVINLGLVLLIVGVNSFTLINDRQHYTVFYQSRFEGIATDLAKAQKEKGQISAILAGDKDKIAYYMAQQSIRPTYKWQEDFNSPKAMMHYLAHNPDSFLFVGFISENTANTLNIAQIFYPHIIWQGHYEGGTTYLLSKEQHQKSDVQYFSFTQENRHKWQSLNDSKITSLSDSNPIPVYRYNENSEWGPSIILSPEELVHHDNDFIDITSAIYSADYLTNTYLVATIKQGDSTLFWEGVNMQDFDRPKHWSTIPLSIKLSDFRQSLDNTTLSIYIWNQGKNSCFLKDIKVSIRKGNPIVYGLMEEIKNAKP